MADENELDIPENLEEEKEQDQAAAEGGDQPATPDTPDIEAAADDPDKVVNPDDASEDDAEAAMMAMMEEGGGDDPDKVVNPDDADEGDAEAAMMAMLEELPNEDLAGSPDDIDFGASASKAEFQQLSEPAGNAEPQGIGLLMDVNLPVAIELGRTKMSIADILGLGPGSVVELNKLAGEPVDLLVNDKVVARGEVVVIDENFGVRITQLLTPEERLKALGEQ